MSFPQPIYPCYVAAGAAASTWDPANTGSGITFANGNRDATGNASGFISTRLNSGHSSGAWYFEFLEVSVSVNDASTLTDICDSTVTNFSSYTLSSGWWGRFDGFNNAAGSFSTVAAPSGADGAGTVVMMAVDATNGSVWIGYNGTWNGATPVSGSTTGRRASFTGGLTVYPVAAIWKAATTVRSCATAAQQTYSPPSGFTAWG